LPADVVTKRSAFLIRDGANLKPADFADDRRLKQASCRARSRRILTNKKIASEFPWPDKFGEVTHTPEESEKRPRVRDAAVAFRPLREFLGRRYTGVQQSKALNCQEKNQLDKKKERKKKDRERRVAQKKHAEAQKRTQDEKTAQETSKTGRKSGLFTIPVTAPKPTQIAASVPKPFNHRRGGGG
jgi:hypothetical protein